MTITARFCYDFETRLRDARGSSMQNSTPDHAECPCLAGNLSFQDFDERGVGDDSLGGEVAVLRCKRCGQFWLRYLMEYPHLTAAGRWIQGPITPEIAASVVPEAARELLEKLGWYFRGGSAFNGKIIETSPGKLNLWLGVSAPESAQPDDE
jgi:hypothetical protein